MSTKKLASLAMTLDIAKFKDLCKLFNPEIAVMVRGRHGIGKSQVIHQVADELRDDFYKDAENCASMVEALKNEPAVAKKIAKTNGKWTYEMGIPVIERRLSQMTEGDIIGLPFLEKNGTEYKPVTWLLNSCKYPVALFLDELNRAIKGVEQATFQLADSKAFYGNLLNSGTRIYVAVNLGSSYSVEEFDPAALSRYAIVDLEPSVEEFCDYCYKIGCDPLLPEFIRANPSSLESKEDVLEPNKKTPDRRAWIKTDKQLRDSKLYEDCNNVKFLHLCAAMLGFHHGNHYWDYVKNNQFNISAKEVLYSWKDARKRLPKDEINRQNKYIDLSTRINQYLIDNDVSADAAIVGPHLRSFIEECPAECAISLFSALSKNEKNLHSIAKQITDVIVKRTSSYSKPQTEEQTEEENKPKNGNTVVPRQRK